VAPRPASPATPRRGWSRPPAAAQSCSAEPSRCQTQGCWPTDSSSPAREESDRTHRFLSLQNCDATQPQRLFLLLTLKPHALGLAALRLDLCTSSLQPAGLLPSELRGCSVELHLVLSAEAVLRR
jgi:hypothetical protein